MKFKWLCGASALLSSYIILCFFRPPQISDSLIIGFLSALLSFLHFLSSKYPDQIKPSKESEDLIKQLEVLKLTREVSNLNLDINRIHNQVKSKESQFKF